MQTWPGQGAETPRPQQMLRDARRYAAAHTGRKEPRAGHRQECGQMPRPSRSAHSLHSGHSWLSTTPMQSASGPCIGGRNDAAYPFPCTLRSLSQRSWNSIEWLRCSLGSGNSRPAAPTHRLHVRDTRPQLCTDTCPPSGENDRKPGSDTYRQMNASSVRLLCTADMRSILEVEEPQAQRRTWLHRTQRFAFNGLYRAAAACHSSWW